MNFREYLADRLNDPEFAEAWKETEGEYQAMRTLYLARTEKNLTQQELSEIAHVPQKTISMIETERVNTSVGIMDSIVTTMEQTIHCASKKTGISLLL